MGEVAVQILKWSVRISFVMVSIFAFIVVINLGLSMAFVALNGNLLTDILAFTQVWLPFDLNVLIGWALAASVSYVAYRLTMMGLMFLNKILGDT